ncbi:hypothetical protein HXX76_010605 [Chlamydomonas incerta]|uniref:DEAD box RNA helicase n=1 Tax=Chlamydomonas incerta TaxID=51695 RepID=A0A835VYL5_CHLIN|nr:hypothetical protein HXX76_010605 [Chlamydomonas incerta]|eukprot:KAG2429821.1 hypothetical protein HXX76_010605 [Chlamydomonas incerta]
MDFGSLGVTPALQAQLAARGLRQPLPVQAAAVPLVLSGRDVAIKSCTGSGKTLAFVLPVIQLALQRRAAAEAAAAAAAAVAASGPSAAAAGEPAAASVTAAARSRATALKQAARGVQAVIVAPSRELGIQIQRAAQELLPPSAPRQLVQQVIGGANLKRQAAALSGGEAGVWPAVVVGSPGRLADLVQRGVLAVWSCPVLVLDEVDTLLAHDDFRSNVDTIASHVGRRVAAAATGTPPPPPAAVAPAASSSGSGSGSGSSPGGGRQTVLVSASLDPQRLEAYSRWCAQPAAADAGAAAASGDARSRQLALVALDSTAALPEQYLRQQLLRAQGVGGPESGEVKVALRPTAAAASDEAELARSDGPGAPSRDTTHTPSPSPDLPSTGPNSSNRDSTDTSTGSGTDATTASSRLAGILPPHLAHVYVLSPAEHRTDRARRLIHALGAERALVFVGRGNQAMVTKYKLEARNMEVSVLHGQLSRLERSNIVAAFRRGAFRALVATDLAARGLDLPDCDAVINLGLAPDALAYAHRAGRAGRAGAPGVVASVVSRAELRALGAAAARLGVTLQAISVAHGSIAPQDQVDQDGGEETVREPAQTAPRTRRDFRPKSQ